MKTKKKTNTNTNNKRKTKTKRKRKTTTRRRRMIKSIMNLIREWISCEKCGKNDLYAVVLMILSPSNWI